MLEPEAIAVRRGSYLTPSVTQRAAKVLSERIKTLWTLTALSSSQTFSSPFFFSQLNSLLAWLVFPNSQGTPEVGQYGIIVSWGTVNLWKTPFAFWIYGKHLNLVSLEQHLETQCFDFPNNFPRIIGNENSKSPDGFFPQATYLSRCVIYLSPSTKDCGAGKCAHSAVLRRLGPVGDGSTHIPTPKPGQEPHPSHSRPWEAQGSSTSWTELFLLLSSTVHQ